MKSPVKIFTVSGIPKMREATDSLDKSSRNRFHVDLIMVRASPVGPSRKSKDLEIHN